MWSSDLHISGLVKFPKEWRIAGSGKFSQKTPSAGSSVTGIHLFYRARRASGICGKLPPPEIVLCDKVSALWQAVTAAYAQPTMEQKIPTIQDLYPHLTAEERAIAEDNLERYLTLVLRIFERLEAEADQGLRNGRAALPSGTGMVGSDGSRSEVSTHG